MRYPKVRSPRRGRWGLPGSRALPDGWWVPLGKTAVGDVCQQREGHRDGGITEQTAGSETAPGRALPDRAGVGGPAPWHRAARRRV